MTSELLKKAADPLGLFTGSGIMDKGGGSIPDAPDPQQLLNQQVKYNRMNQFTPGGSLRFLPGGGVKVNVNQRLRDMQRGQQRAAVQGAQNVQGVQRRSALEGKERFRGGNQERQRRRMERALFNKQMSLLDPQFARQEDILRQSLADRGLPSGSEAFSAEYGDFLDAQNRARTEASINAINFSGQEAQRQFGNRLQTFGTNVGARQAEIQDALNLMNPGGVQMTSLNDFYQPGQVDVMSPYNLQAQTQQAQAQMAQQQAELQKSGINSLLGSAGSMGMMMCSKDFKNETGPAPKVLDKLRAIPVQSWAYKWDTTQHAGPYAEDFKEIFGLGDGRTINPMDVLMVMFMAIKELAEERNEK